MGYLSNFDIGASVDSNCGYIEITDNTSYPVELDSVDRERVDIGIAVFWSLDDFVTDAGSDLTNGTSWYINNPITATYYVRAYIVPVWAAGAWAATSIVFHEGYFYYTAAGTSDRPTYGISNGWTLVTAQATFEDNLYTLDVINYGYASLSQETTCYPYIINKTGAGLYTVEFAASLTFRTLYITYYNGDELDPVYSEVIQAGSVNFDVDISSEGDGVFIFTFEEFGSDVYQYVVYETSALSACVNSITQQVMMLCSDDPCLENCLNTDQAEEVNLRNELNKMILLSSNVRLKINVESVTYLNIFTIDTTRQQYINEVGDLVEKTNSIVESCGNCSS